MRLVVEKGILSEHKGGAVRCGQSVLSEGLYAELVGSQSADSKEKDVTKLKEAALLKKLRITKDTRVIKAQRKL